MTDIRFGLITKETFKEEIKRILEKRGYMAELNTFNRSGTKYEGIAVHTKEDALTPVVPVDVLYQDYLTCSEKALQDKCVFTLDDAVDCLLEEIRKSKIERGIPGTKEILEMVYDWKTAKGKLILYACGLEKNREYLENKVYQIIAEDIALVPGVQVSYINAECASVIPVTKDLAGEWGLSEDEIIEAAKESAASLRPVEIINLRDMTKKAMIKDGMPEFLADTILSAHASPDTYAVTNTYKMHGASAVFYHGVADRIRKDIGDFYIMPSSEAEVIIVSVADADKFGMDASSLKEFVTSTNQDESLFQDAKVLTNSLYIYDGKIFKKVC